MPFEVVTAPEGAETVVADEVLELEGAVLLNHHHLKWGGFGGSELGGPPAAPPNPPPRPSCACRSLGDCLPPPPPRVARRQTWDPRREELGGPSAPGTRLRRCRGGEGVSAAPEMAPDPPQTPKSRGDAPLGEGTCLFHGFLGVGGDRKSVV